MTSMARELNRASFTPIEDALVFMNTTYEQTLGLFLLYGRLAAIPKKQVVVEEICLALHINLQLEEEVFYPAAKLALDKQGALSAAIMRNSVLKYLVNEIETLECDSDIFDIKIKVLCEQVKEHINEKRVRLFPQIKTCGKLNIWDLGVHLNLFKSELLNKIVS